MWIYRLDGSWEGFRVLVFRRVDDCWQKGLKSKTGCSSSWFISNFFTNTSSSVVLQLNRSTHPSRGEMSAVHAQCIREAFVWKPKAPLKHFSALKKENNKMWRVTFSAVKLKTDIYLTGGMRLYRCSIKLWCVSGSTFVVMQLLAARLHHLVIHSHPRVLHTELGEHL